MSFFRLLRAIYLCYFSKPVENRPLYRAIRRLRVRKLVELGVGDGLCALRMIELAKIASAKQQNPTAGQETPGQKQETSPEIHYVGIDPFEGAHRRRTDRA